MSGGDTRIGRIGVQIGMLDEEALQKALAEQRDGGDDAPRLGQILIRQGVISETDLEEILRVQQFERVRFAIEGYEILDQVGQGSMGIVYRARQLSLDRTVAIKVLSPRLTHKKGHVEWFLKEARTVARLNHANIISGIDSGQAGGHRYFVMEFVDGPSLSDIIERGGALDEGRALDFACQIARALDYAHRNHLIHRDIKPHNILVAPGGVAKVCDLGLAKRPVGDAVGSKRKGSGEGGGIFGTPYYISPEQVRGLDEIDIRSDIYSLGMTLYTMLTGRVPFHGRQRTAVLAAHLAEYLDDLEDICPDLLSRTYDVFEAMTAKDRNERYANPSELIDDLQLCISELRLRENPGAHAVPARRRRASRRRR